MTGRGLVAPRGDEAAPDREHHAALHRIVARRVRMSADLVEDACRRAWLILMRYQPERGPALLPGSAPSRSARATASPPTTDEPCRCTGPPTTAIGHACAASPSAADVSQT
jgi:hypothetical protein